MNPFSPIPPPEPEPEGAAPSVELVEFRPPPTEAGTAVNVESVWALFLRERIGYVWWALVLAALIALAVYVGWPLYLRLHALRAAALAKVAEAQASQHLLDEAVATVQAAYVRDASAPEVMRAMAMTLTALNYPGALTYWTAVLRQPDATNADRHGAAAYALGQGLVPEATALVNELLAREKSPANLLLAAQLDAQRGDTAAAIEHAAAATAGDPANANAALFLATQQLRDPAAHATGFNSLLQLATGNSPVSGAALTQLADEESLAPPEVDAALAQLQARPVTREEQRLAVLALEIRQHPENRAALLDAALKDHAQSTPGDLVLFLDWLNLNHEPERVLEAVPATQALLSSGLADRCVQALIGLKRWPTLKIFLESDSVPLESAQIQFYHARCEEEMGNAHASDVDWEQAVLDASGNPRLMFFLALHTEQLGENSRAEAVYLSLAQQPLFARLAFFGLQRVDHDRPTKTLAAIADQMAARWPLDAGISADAIYYNLLLNKNTAALADRAEARWQSDPGSLVERTNLALADLRLGRNEAALNLYRDDKTAWDTAPVAARIVYGAVLAANGRRDDAQTVVAALDRGALRPEEQALLAAIPTSP